MTRRPAPDTVRTPRLMGRRPDARDIGYVRAIGSDWKIQETLFQQLWSEAECHERLERWLRAWQEDGFGFWIFEDEHGDAVGHAGVFHSSERPDELEVGYILKPDFWGEGLATEMLRGVVDVALTVLGQQNLIANTMPENVASRRVLEKCGFKYVRQTLYAGRYPNVEYRLQRSESSTGDRAVKS
jgi:[ribosomal protein S5]-alanine N-acetyltransferase